MIESIAQTSRSELDTLGDLSTRERDQHHGRHSRPLATIILEMVRIILCAAVVLFLLPLLLIVGIFAFVVSPWDFKAPLSLSAKPSLFKKSEHRPL